MEVVFLDMSMKERLWGGSKLAEVFGLDIPSPRTGEAWCISAHKNGLSHIISPEKYQGQSLADFYQKEPAFFGYPKMPVFPLLTKIIDAASDLSVQVHPADDYALLHENDLGKNECWYIISAEEGASIIYGHRAKDRQDFVKQVADAKWDELLIKVPVKEGDFFDVPSGVVHAIGQGVCILETQQSSDTTYRLYDFDRVDAEGKKRELHIEKSLDVITYPHIAEKGSFSEELFGKSRIKKFVENDFFTVWKWEVRELLEHDLPADKYILATVIKGSGEMRLQDESYELKLASSFLLPVGNKELSLKGDMDIIFSCSNQGGLDA